jgi:hypothetical protein
MAPSCVPAREGRSRSQRGSNSLWQAGVTAARLHPVLPLLRGAWSSAIATGAAASARVRPFSTGAESVWTRTVLLQQNDNFIKGQKSLMQQPLSLKIIKKRVRTNHTSLKTYMLYIISFITKTGNPC